MYLGDSEHAFLTVCQGARVPVYTYTIYKLKWGVPYRVHNLCTCVLYPVLYVRVLYSCTVHLYNLYSTYSTHTSTENLRIYCIYCTGCTILLCTMLVYTGSRTSTRVHEYELYEYTRRAHVHLYSPASTPQLPSSQQAKYVNVASTQKCM